MTWTSRVAAAPRGNTFAFGRNRWNWDQFDALPQLVRDVINYAPTRLGTDRVWRALKGGASVEVVARQEVLLARRFAGQHVLDTYGPNHPQAPSHLQ